MNNTTRAIDAFHADRAARFQAEAQRDRIADESRIARRADRTGGRRIRRVLGGSIVRLGARIAADPAVERGVVAAAHGGGGQPANLKGVPQP